jgi:hypothetical protein
MSVWDDILTSRLLYIDTYQFLFGGNKKFTD